MLIITPIWEPTPSNAGVGTNPGTEEEPLGSSHVGRSPCDVGPLVCTAGDLLTHRLLEASAALSQWQATMRGTHGPGQDLVELAQALNEDSRVQAEAAREIADLLDR